MIEDFSKENNLDPKYVNAVVSSYFKEVKNCMTSLDHTRVKILNLGKFYCLHYKYDDKILHLKRLLNCIPPTTFQNIIKHNAIEEKLNKCILLKEKHDKEQERIRIYKEARKATRLKRD